jgi:DNA mismatch endonuclease, patch repair protein
MMSRRRSVTSAESTGKPRPSGMTDYPHPSTAAASAVMRANRKTNTKPELAVRRLLHARGYRYRVNYRIKTDVVIVRPDIVFTKRRLAVFIDGCFWHNCPQHGNRPNANQVYWSAKLDRNKQRDILVSEGLEESGWEVLRIWEHVPPVAACEMIITALSNTSEHRSSGPS